VINGTAAEARGKQQGTAVFRANVGASSSALPDPSKLSSVRIAGVMLPGIVAVSVVGADQFLRNVPGLAPVLKNTWWLVGT
jgi:hypothetical protein